MISYKYSINEFLHFVEGKTVVEAILLAQQEAGSAEAITRGGRRGAPAARAAGCDSYAADLKGFIFFLSNGIKPAGVYDGTYHSFISTAHKLVGIDEERLCKLESGSSRA